MTSVSSTSSTSGTTSSTTSSTSSTSSSSSSSSATQALLSSLGGSSIDVTGLATELSTAEYAGQTDQLNTRNTKLTTQISEASTLMSMTSSLTSSINTLITSGALASTPTIANSQVATVSAGSVQGSGSSTLEVTALAQGQTVASSKIASGTTDVGSGSLTITFGTISGTSFTADSSKTAVTVNIAAGSSLSDVAASINSANAGVVAYVATNSNGQQLVLSGPQGAANAFTVSASEDATDPGLAKFVYDPSSTSNTGATLAQAAGDAAYTLNGVQRTSSSNVITDAAPGISLNLTGTNKGNPTTISFSDPTSAVSTAMTNLVTALNQIVSELNTDTAAGAALNNNPGARALQQKLSTLISAKVMPNAASGEPSTLGDLGLKVEKDGTFSLDSTTLNKTIAASPKGVSAMFTTGLYGVYATFYNLSSSVNSSADGNSLAGQVSLMKTQQTTLSTQLSDLADKQSKLRTQLISQFSALNTIVSASKSTQSFLTQQVALWTNKTN